MAGPSWPQPMASTLPSKARLRLCQEVAAFGLGEARHGIDVAQDEKPAAEPGDQVGDAVARLDHNFAVRSPAHAGGQRKGQDGGPRWAPESISAEVSSR